MLFLMRFSIVLIILLVVNSCKKESSSKVENTTKVESHINCEQAGSRAGEGVNEIY